MDNRSMKNKVWASGAAIGLLTLLAGCHHDKEEPARLNAAASVPAVTVQKVTQVVSPMGSASVAQAGSLPPLSGAGETYLLATGQDGEVLLAALDSADRPAPALSAETTAVALVRLARGTQPAGVSAEAFNAAIQAAAGHAPLRALVRAAHAAGTAPMRYPGVTAAVLVNLGQALDALPTAEEGRATALALATERVNAPLPFDLLRASLRDPLRLRVQDATPAAPGVLLFNGLPISFGARGEDPAAQASGLPLLPPGDESPTVLVFSRALQTGGPGTPDPVAVPGPGLGWNLAVFRTPGTRTYDGRELAVELWNTALQGLGALGEACLLTVASAYPPGGTVAAWSVRERDEGFAGLRAELESGALLQAPAQASAACLRERLAALPAAEQARVRAFLRTTEAEGLWQQVRPFARAQLALWLSTLELPALTADGTAWALALYAQAPGGASRALVVRNAWSWTRTVGICQYQRPETGQWQINPCPSELEFDRRSLTLPIGSRYRYDLIARDAQGNRIATPPGLRFTSSSGAVTVTQDGEITVQGLAIFGVVFIDVTDPASGVRATAVVEPVLGAPTPPETETLDFETGIWLAGSYFQGGPNPGTPGGSGFRFSRNGGLDDPLLSRSSGRYVSGLQTARPPNAASDPYFVAVERSDGQPFEALSVDIGLFDNASGSSFQRPALLIVGVRADGSQETFTPTPADFQSFGSGAALSTFTMPAGFAGLRRLEIRLKLNPNACSSCRVALTVDNLAVR